MSEPMDKVRLLPLENENDWNTNFALGIDEWLSKWTLGMQIGHWDGALYRLALAWMAFGMHYWT